MKNKGGIQMRKGSVVLIALVVSVFVIVCTGNTFAEIRAGSFTVTPRVGGYDFDTLQELSNRAVYGLGFGYNYTEHFGVESSFGYIDTESERGSKGDADVYLYHLDGLYHITPEKRIVPYLAAGIGGMTVDEENEGNDTDVVFNFGGGIKFFVTEAFALRADVRQYYPFEDSVNDYAYTFGLTYQFGGKPKEVPPLPPQDSDGDGVIDDLDRCPDTPSGVSVDRNGCPLDSDRDGVPDYKDKCPNTPRGVSVDRDGCPLDSDRDGVPDYKDKCPDTPRGVKVDADGCPPKKVIILEDVHFDFDKATLTNEAKSILKRNIMTMIENPGIVIHIEGHTCAHGPEEYNLRLSERRANAVKEYMEKEGNISSRRMNTITYGETRLAMPEIPTPYNKNSREAKANRRVHFEVIVH
jgi:OOP family OmpA-OmpF porin